jgi:D-alanyl-D-alanine carboxypeptidase (penicillin-binding protein 5/6)
MSSSNERSEESRKMLEWGLHAFRRTEIFAFAAGETVGAASVFGGAKSDVTLKAKGPVSILVPLTNRDSLKARIVYQGPILAPVEEGQKVGDLKVWIGDTLSQQTPVYAAETVERGTLKQRALDAVGELMVGWLR